MAYYIVTFLHVIVCLILILVVLLQSGKGADLAGAFGGGATQTAFGSRGPASFLSKLTTVSAVLFMATCLTLSLLGSRQESKSILEDTKGTTTPAPKAPALQPLEAPPTPEEIKRKQEEIEKKKQTPPASKPGEAKPEPAKETKSPQGTKKS